MPRYEYKVVPAPSKGRKAQGIRGAEARFSHTLEELMNELAAEGWEYQRAETLPSQERSGLTGTTTEWRNVLVCRRLRKAEADVAPPELLPAPSPAAETASVAPSATTSSHQAGGEDTGTSSIEAAPTAPGDAVRQTAERSWNDRAEDVSEVSPVGSSDEKLVQFRKPSSTED